MPLKGWTIQCSAVRSWSKAWFVCVYLIMRCHHVVSYRVRVWQITYIHEPYEGPAERSEHKLIHTINTIVYYIMLLKMSYVSNARWKRKYPLRGWIILRLQEELLLSYYAIPCIYTFKSLRKSTVWSPDGARVATFRFQTRVALRRPI